MHFVRLELRCWFRGLATICPDNSAILVDKTENTEQAEFPNVVQKCQ